ncbi:Fpg/Nei family DNA glycosylase [Isoptericola haloaureus]|uniref:DNA-(apurinic or apyrimidinic site) lyase n=1 Tax=Isoptericola haloaureus TaxID=1542902 RepID=A0ABU7Z6K8_9MICO
MPEGHTVHRLARTLDQLFAGRRLAVSSPQGRFAAGADVLDGATLVGAEAWGKQLFCRFDVPGPDAGAYERWLRVHLGLYGAWTFAGDGSADVAHAIGAPRRRVGERETTLSSEPSDQAAGGRDPRPAGPGEWTAPEPRGAVRVRLLAPHAVADLTGPTACEVLTPDEKAAVEDRLGPDPIRPDGGHDSLEAARAAFVARVRRSRVTVGQQLIDQAVVAGVGNIYRAEALFRAGLDPLRPGRDVAAAVLEQIWDDLVALLRDGAASGRIVTTRPEHRDDGGAAHGGGATGDEQARAGAVVTAAGRRRTRQNTDDDPDAVPAHEAFYVYHREGLPCRVCGTPVLIEELAGRNLFWCGVCQT